MHRTYHISQEWRKAPGERGVDGGWAPVYNYICESDQRWLQVRRQGVVLGDNIQCKISNEFLNSSRVSHIDRIYIDSVKGQPARKIMNKERV